MKIAASNYFSGFTESSSLSSSDSDDLHEPQDNTAPIGALRRADVYAALLNAYVADAASFSLPAATAVERSSAASPSSPADDDDPSPVAEDLTEDYGSYLLEFLGLESSPSEGQVTDDIAETNQKPMSHEDSYSQQEQSLFDLIFYSSTESDENYFLLKHDTEESSVESGSEIHNVNVQLQNDSFINPNDSSNYQDEAAPIHYNPWSIEDWITYINFNNKYMDMPPEVASAVGSPPPFYSDPQYIALSNAYVADPASLPVTVVEQRSPVGSPSSAPADEPSPVAEDSTDGQEEQFASDLRFHGFIESTEKSSPKHNNVESGSSNEGEFAPMHYHPWNFEDWRVHMNFNNKYMASPEVDLAPPPYGGFSYYSYSIPVMQVDPLIFNVPYCPVNDNPLNPESCAKNILDKNNLDIDDDYEIRARELGEMDPTSARN